MHKVFSEANSSFTDIAGHGHEAAIKAIALKNVIHGYPDGTFMPSKVLSRSDLIKMLGKYLVSRGYEVPADYKSYIRFSDLSAKTDDELLRYSALLHDLGIVQGSSGKLNPYDPILREQIAAVLSRLINVLLDLDVSAYIDYSAELNSIRDLNSTFEGIPFSNRCFSVL